MGTGNTTYRCARCQGTFQKNRSDEEALTEFHDTWTVTDDPVIICDDCYQRIYAWAQAEHPEFFRHSQEKQKHER